MGRILQGHSFRALHALRSFSPHTPQAASPLPRVSLTLPSHTPPAPSSQGGTTHPLQPQGWMHPPSRGAQGKAPDAAGQDRAHSTSPHTPQQLHITYSSTTRLPSPHQQPEPQQALRLGACPAALWARSAPVLTSWAHQGPAEPKGVGNPSWGPVNQQKPGFACEQRTPITLEKENSAQLAGCRPAGPCRATRDTHVMS